MNRCVLITFLITGLLTVNSFAQSAKKSFEYAAMYEANKDYKKALYWYCEGMMKGKLSNYTEGRNEYYRVLEIYITASFSTPGTSKEQLLQRTTELDSIYKSRLSDFKSNPELKDKFNLKATELSTYATNVRIEYKNGLSHSNQSQDIKQASKIYDEAVALYTKAKSYPFIDKEAFDTEFWSPELWTLDGAVSSKIMKANCDEVYRVLEATLKDYASKNYRKAFIDLTNIIDWGKNIPKEKCDAIQKANNLLIKVTDEGQSRVIIMPVKSKGDEFSELSRMLATRLNSYEDDLLKVIPQKEYESELYKNEIDIEELRGLNAISLSKLNKALNIRYMVLPRVVSIREGQPQYQRTPDKAFEVWYEEETTSSGTKIKKWYTKGSVTYHQVVGEKQWVVAIETKIYDILRKTIIYNKTEDLTYTSSVDYYEGINPEGYSNTYLGYSQRRALFSGLDSGSDKWRAHFYRDKEFADTDSVLKLCQEDMKMDMPPVLYKALGGIE